MTPSPRREELRGGPAGPSYCLCLRPNPAVTALAAALLLFSLRPAAAQEGNADSALARVVAAALEAPDLTTMAAGLVDTIGGRLSGTPMGTRAEAWAAQWLRRLGADTVWYEVVAIPAWRRGATEVRVASPGALRHHRITAVTYGYSPGIVSDSIPVVDIGRGDPAALATAGSQLRGAALLTDGVVSPELVAVAAGAGAAALLRTSLEPGRLPQARLAPVAEPPAPLPILALSREDGSWLRRQAAVGPLSLSFRVEAETRQGTAANVVAEWRGSDPEVADEVLLLGAHLDSWDLGDGALDNGTGVLAALGAMQAVADGGGRPRRTFRLVLFAAEELGLLGSRAYVEAHEASLSRIVAMMNLDMVGAAEGYGATGHAEADTLFARLTHHPSLLEQGLSGEVNHGGGPGSDHQPFLLAGVPTIYVRTSLSPDAPRWYHNAGDTLDKVDLDGVRGTAAAAAAALWALADHAGRPLRHLSREETRLLVQRLGW